MKLDVDDSNPVKLTPGQISTYIHVSPSTPHRHTEDEPVHTLSQHHACPVLTCFSLLINDFHEIGKYLIYTCVLLVGYSNIVN